VPARPNILGPSPDVRETRVRQHLDDPIRQYLDAVGGTALLSAEEEVDLARRIEAGVYAAELLRQSDAGESTLSADRRAELELVAADGREAKDHMVRANLRLVVSVARRYAREVPLLEVVQEGNLGLIRAVEKFDYAKGFKFSTYATWWIRQAIQRALPELMRVVRLPVHVSEELSRMRRAERRLAQQLDRDPTAEEVAAALDSRVERIEELRDIDRRPVSLDAPVGETEDSATVGDLLDLPGTAEVGEGLEREDLVRQVHALLAELPEREAYILTLRFGLDGQEPQTAAQVAKAVGLSRERVRQLEAKSLRALVEPRRRQDLDLAA